MTSGGTNCGGIETEYCHALNDLDDCCPECTEATSTYYQCAVEAVCPEVTFSCDGIADTDGLAHDVATTSAPSTPSSDAMELSEACGDSVTVYFMCVMGNCADSSCSLADFSAGEGEFSALPRDYSCKKASVAFLMFALSNFCIPHHRYSIEDEENIDIGDCGALKTNLCEELSNQKDCCPNCLDSFVALVSCAMETEGVSCPDLECDGTFVLASGGANFSEGSMMKSVTSICIFALYNAVY